MPMIELTYPQGAIGREALEAAVEKLTAALLRHEGAPENERIRAIAWTFVNEIPAGRLFKGGVPSEVGLYRVVLSVPEGTLLHGPGPFGEQARRNLIREVTEIVLEAEGTAYSDVNAGRVWCFVSEIQEGFWGGLGTVFKIEDIAGFANDELPATPLSERARAALSDYRANPELAGATGA
jgi:phenylpyruvate tautomerase PptA (4-oxalocrotonate tautomerase family)